ncbi:hypothetical protein K9L97_02380 [Candidatus Woesearchaeota archaeon]|nr:hypothetical protein [Candidatus Woesearchaeota archaeon]
MNPEQLYEKVKKTVDEANKIRVSRNKKIIENLQLKKVNQKEFLITIDTPESKHIFIKYLPQYTDQENITHKGKIIDIQNNINTNEENHEKYLIILKESLL